MAGRIVLVMYCLGLGSSLLAKRAVPDAEVKYPPCDHVDVLELNHYYDEKGQHNFSQLIGWTWSESKTEHASQYHVAWWMLWKSVDQARPARDYRRGGHVLIVRRGEELRCIRAKSFYESWTQYDPEVLDRQQFPQSQRVGLLKLSK